MLDEVAIVSIIGGVVEVIKRVGLPSRFCGLLAIILGVIISVGYNKSFDFSPIILGVMYGLSASGAYEGVSRIAPPTTKFIGKMVK